MQPINCKSRSNKTTVDGNESRARTMKSRPHLLDDVDVEAGLLDLGLQVHSLLAVGSCFGQLVQELQAGHLEAEAADRADRVIHRCSPLPGYENALRCPCRYSALCCSLFSVGYPSLGDASASSVQLSKPSLKMT